MLARVKKWLANQVGKEARSYLLHTVAIIALCVVVRPLMMNEAGAKLYDAPLIIQSLIEEDIRILILYAKRHTPAAPRYVLFLFVPTLAFLLTRRRLRWTDWEHGRALRFFIMAIVVMLCWSGSTHDYNLVLDRLWIWDRLLLVFLCGLSWFTPLAVPFAARFAVLMIKSSYHPIRSDEFDFLPTMEILSVFTVFVWLSIRKSFKPKHYLIPAIASLAAYYYQAGLYKFNKGTWVDFNHVTNVGMAGYIRGWVNFIPENIIVPLYDFLWTIDPALAWFVIIFEVGSIVGFFLHPKITMVWVVFAFTLHFGIAALSGVVFWKWMWLTGALFLFLRRPGGGLMLKEMCRYKLVLLLGIASIYFSANRIWYRPKLGVVWYDTRLVMNYTWQAVGESGKRYLVDPNFYAPMDMAFVQGRYCYVAGSRAPTAIYGVTGSLTVARALDEADSVDVAKNLINRSRPCRGNRWKKAKAAYTAFMTKFWQNLNRHGGKRPHAWLRWIGRPTHLHVHQQGNHFDESERIAAIELHLQPVFWHAGKLHRFEKKRVHSLPIPR